MPKNIKDLYQSLRKAGEISDAITFERFQSKWNDLEFRDKFHKKLVRKQLTRMTYEQFDAAWNNDIVETPTVANSANNNNNTIELSEEELKNPELAGKPIAGPQPQEDSASEFKSGDFSLASFEQAKALKEQFPDQIADDAPVTEYDYEQTKKYLGDVNKMKLDLKAQENIATAFANNPDDYNKAVLASKEMAMISDYAAKILNEDLPKKPKTIADRAAGAFLVNMPQGLESAWKATQAMAVNYALDPKTYGMPESFEFSENIARDRDQYVIDKINEVQSINQKMTNPGGIISGIKSGDAEEVLGGIFNAMQGVFSTVGPGMVTGGASLAPQIIAPTWVDYQTTKAATLYPDSQDPVAELIENGEDDLFVPLTLGVGMLALEKAGFKGMSKYISGTATGRKLMGIPTDKVAWIMTNNKEALTEWGQGGIEQINTELAKGKRIDAAVGKAFNHMLSEEGFEAALQGWIGSGVLTGPTAVNNSLTRALRTDGEGQKRIIGGIERINHLRNERLKTQSATTRKAYDAEISVIEADMKQYLKENNRKIKHLSPKDRKRLETIVGELDSQDASLKKLEEELSEGVITKKEYGYSKRALNNKKKTLSDEIADIKSNIDASKRFDDINNLLALAKNNKNLKITMADDPASLAEAMKDAVHDDGRAYTKSQIKDASGSVGTMWTDSKGVKHIAINQNLAIDEGRTATGEHEGLHFILNEVLKADKDLAIAMKKAVETSLKKLASEGKVFGQTTTKVTEDGKEIQVTQFEERTRLYEDTSESMQAEEYLTILSEMMRTNQISVQDINRGILGNVRELTRRIFLDLGIKKHNITGDGVLQFLQDYNREFQRGRLSAATRKILDAEMQENQEAKTDIDQATGANNENDADGLGEVRESRKHKDNYVNQLVKKRNLTQKQAGEQAEEILRFVETATNPGDTKPLIKQDKRTKIEKVSLHWMLNGNLRMPEDQGILRQAIDVGQRRNVDFFAFNSPQELVENFRVVEASKKLTDPLKFKTFTNKTESHGYEVYVIDDSTGIRQGMEDVRAIAEEHFGKTFNTWCLIWKDPKRGNYDWSSETDEAAKNWKHYGRDKKLLFRDGKLVALGVKNNPQGYDEAVDDLGEDQFVPFNENNEQYYDDGNYDDGNLEFLDENTNHTWYDIVDRGFDGAYPMVSKINQSGLIPGTKIKLPMSPEKGLKVNAQVSEKSGKIKILNYTKGDAKQSLNPDTKRWPGVYKEWDAAGKLSQVKQDDYTLTIRRGKRGQNGEVVVTTMKDSYTDGLNTKEIVNESKNDLITPKNMKSKPFGVFGMVEGVLSAGNATLFKNAIKEFGVDSINSVYGSRYDTIEASTSSDGENVDDTSQRIKLKGVKINKQTADKYGLDVNDTYTINVVDPGMAMLVESFGTKSLTATGWKNDVSKSTYSELVSESTGNTQRFMTKTAMAMEAVLHKNFPTYPGVAAGLDARLEWIKSTNSELYSMGYEKLFLGIREQLMNNLPEDSESATLTQASQIIAWNKKNGQSYLIKDSKTGKVIGLESTLKYKVEAGDVGPIRAMTGITLDSSVPVGPGKITEETLVEAFAGKPVDGHWRNTSERAAGEFVPNASNGIRSSKSLYERTDETYSTYADIDKATAGFLIAEEWRNQVAKKVRKYRNAPGYDTMFEDLIEDVLIKGSQSIVGGVNSFKPGTALIKEGESGDQTVSGWINSYLGNWINYHAKKKGLVGDTAEGLEPKIQELEEKLEIAIETDDFDKIDSIQDQIDDLKEKQEKAAKNSKFTGFTSDVTELRDLTSDDNADALVLEVEKVSEQEAKFRPDTISKAIKLSEDKDLTAYFENLVALNLSANLDKYGAARSKNVTQDKFINAIVNGVKSDEATKGEFLRYIIESGAETFLINHKNDYLANVPRDKVASHSLHKKIIQQKINGRWVSKQPLKNAAGKVTGYEYLQPNGKPYPQHHPDMDRAKASVTGTTSGAYFYRKNPNLDSAISTNEFVDAYFKDGAGRTKLNKVKLKGFASNAAAQIGVEMFEQQILARKGRIYETFESRMALTTEMTEEQKKEALEAGLLIREGIFGALTDNAVGHMLKDLERGNILQSKANKTGFAWFDKPRIAMGTFLSTLETNDIRDAVVNGTMPNEEYDRIRELLEDAYSKYTNIALYQDTWNATQKEYKVVFDSKKFDTFEDFVNETKDKVSNSVEGLLGIPKTATVLSKKNAMLKTGTKREMVDGYLNDILLNTDNKEAALVGAINLFLGAASGPVDQALYLNSEGFYNEVVLPMALLHDIDLAKFTLVDSKKGQTIAYNGKKITAENGNYVYADDVLATFDDIANGTTAISEIDYEGRVLEAKRAKTQYLGYIDWIAKNKDMLSPVSIGIMLKSFALKNRSIASLMHPITEIMVQHNVTDISKYTTLPSIPKGYVNKVAINYIMNGEGRAELKKVVQDGITRILPAKIANVIDEHHYNDSEMRLDSPIVNEMLDNASLPRVETTSLYNTEVIRPVSDAGIRMSKAVDKEVEKLTKAQISSRDAFSKMITKATGYDAATKITGDIAANRGRIIDRGVKSKFKLLTPNAEDFMGLMYNIIGKGKQGDADMKFIQDKLLNPYMKGIRQLDDLKQQVSREFKAVNAKYKPVTKKLYKYVPSSVTDNFTYDQAVRFYLYNKAGYSELMTGMDDMVNVTKNGKNMKLPISALTGPSGMALLNTGIEILPNTPEGAMLAAVLHDSDILEYAIAISAATRLKEGYVKPDNNWASSGNIASDFHSLVGSEYRAKLLKEFNDNFELMFDEATLNKLESKFGTAYRRAVFNKDHRNPGVLQRMAGGQNAMAPSNFLTDWITGAIAPIMFLNRKSALLQLLSATNYLNFTDNNPIAAAKTASNVSQYVEDIKMILFSDKLKERRSGLKYSVEEAALSNAAGGRDYETVKQWVAEKSVDKALDATTALWDIFKAETVKLGFSLTQAADSFAIAIGGATYYRNRLNTYLKEVDAKGKPKYTAEAAHDLAFGDFSEQTDKAQQSSDQALLSKDQTQGMGRVLLAFANTPAQYTRIMVKAARDIKNRRGSDRENFGKIIYYGILQNYIFNFLSNGAFAAWDLFTGEDEEDDVRWENRERQLYAQYRAKLRKDGKPTYTEARAKAKAKKETEKERIAYEDWLGQKSSNITEGMFDSFLRGAGVRGALVSGAIRFFRALNAEEDRAQLDTGRVISSALSVSPPIAKKAKLIQNYLYSRKYNAELKEGLGFDISSPAVDEFNYLTEAFTNLPATWFSKSRDASMAIFSDAYEASPIQKGTIATGYTPWSLGLTNKDHEWTESVVKAQEKMKKAEEQAQQKILDDKAEQLRILNRTPEQVKRDELEEKRKKSKASRKAAETRKAKKRKFLEERDARLRAARRNK